jgi:hypothetical protein
MACARQIGLSKLPIVCVNVDKFYEPFRLMLERASNDQLLQLEPSQIIHFESTAEEAVRWIEAAVLNDCIDVKVQKRSSVLRESSILHDPLSSSTKSYLAEWFGWKKSNAETSFLERLSNVHLVEATFIFVAGVSLGIFLGRNRQSHLGG